MAWLSRVNFTTSDVLSYTDLNNLGNDIRAWGGNVNGGGYTLSNVVLSASSGTMATVIGGTGTTSTLTLRSTSGVGTTGADIIFQNGNNGGTEVMRILHGGNVGIGVSTANTRLHVDSDVSNTDGTGYDQGQLFVSDSSLSSSGLILGYRYQSGVAEYARIQARNAVGATNIAMQSGGGNVGIGTSSPGTKLDILGANGTTQQIYYRSSDTNWYGRIGQIVNGNTIGSIISSGGAWSVSGVTFSATKDFNGSFPTAALYIGSQYNSALETSFRFLRKAAGSTTTDGAVTELMTIDNGGNVGIGTTPSYRLHVSGGRSAFVANSEPYSVGVGYSSGPAYWIGSNSANNALVFSEGGGSERMRIDSVGNVKVGGTADRATTAGTNQVVIFNGTAPVGTLANGCSFYSTAGEMRVMDAAGNATLLSPHDSVTNEWIYDSSHTPSGKRLKINVERLLRFINDHFGLDCVHDLMEEA